MKKEDMFSFLIFGNLCVDIRLLVREQSKHILFLKVNFSEYILVYIYLKDVNSLPWNSLNPA